MRICFIKIFLLYSQIYINNQRKEDLLDDFIEKLRKENEKCCCLRFRCFLPTSMPNRSNFFNNCIYLHFFIFFI